MLHELRIAEDSQDYSRVKFLQSQLQAMTQQLNVPLSLTSSAVIPNAKG